jgi:hypothetical protein
VFATTAQLSKARVRPIDDMLQSDESDIREDGMDQPPQAHVYRFEDQIDYFTGRIIFKARTGDSMALVPAVRQAVKTADPNASLATLRVRVF